MKITDLDPQVIIVLAIMVIGAIRWFLEQVAGNKGGQDASENAAAEFEDLYEEARREIIDRQSRIQEAPPLPTPERIRTIIPDSSETNAPPPLPDWQRSVTKPKLSAAEQAALARFQAQPKRQGRQRRQAAGSRVRQLLQSPDSARDAIVLAEILGTPKGAN